MKVQNYEVSKVEKEYLFRKLFGYQVAHFGDRIYIPNYFHAQYERGVAGSILNNISIQDVAIGEIMKAVKVFYALEALEVLALHKPDEPDPMNDGQCYGFVPFMKSHERWKADLDEYKKAFNAQFANAIYDYIVLTVAGELRHAGRRSEFHINDYLEGDAEEDSRDNVFSLLKSVEFNARQILEAGSLLFNPDFNSWSSGYGGPKWKTIADAGLMYGNVPDMVFIDHCVDLSHNNSTFFDKGAGMFTLRSSSSYLEFLGSKRYAANPFDIITDEAWCFPPALTDLICRASNLHIIPDASSTRAYWAWKLFNDMYLNNTTISIGYQTTAFLNRIISDNRQEPYAKFYHCSVMRDIQKCGYMTSTGTLTENGYYHLVYYILSEMHGMASVEWNMFAYRPLYWGNNDIGTPVDPKTHTILKDKSNSKVASFCTRAYNSHTDRLRQMSSDRRWDDEEEESVSPSEVIDSLLSNIKGARMTEEQKAELRKKTNDPEYKFFMRNWTKGVIFQ